MDNMDERLVAALKRDGRASLSELAADLGVSRATVRVRLERLRASAEIVGFTVVLKQDVAADPVRALTMIAIEGRGTDRVIRQLVAMAEVRGVHTTNGRWDLIVELGTGTLEDLDTALARIRNLDGVATSETSLLLATKRAS